MNQIILSAIRDRRTLSFSYDGEIRTVEPHCYGVDGKGHEALRAYQIGGKGWRLFHVGGISRLSGGDQTFLVRLDYKRNDKAMDRIYAQV